jgi:glycerol-3-phosphate dehydrogenase (NAD(P)+)
MSNIAVIGAGAWGTALSIVLGRKGTHRVRLWTREPELRRSIVENRVNERFLPGYSIPDGVTATTSFEEALEGAHLVISVMPSQHCRSVFQSLSRYLHKDVLIASATKGLEESTLMRMTQVIVDVVGTDCEFRPRVSAISGPSFAQEVARGDPTAVTVASQDRELAAIVQSELSDPRFRVYTNDDVAGVELGGALKNVIAIAAGICDGMGLGHNSVAALITRGLAEITRLAIASGGHQQTMAGLAGLGDLVLTCTGGLSRNRSVGVELGRGRQLADIIAGMQGRVAEGVFTTEAAVRLAEGAGIEMPICQQVNSILHEGKSPQEAIRELMTRTAKSESYFR